MDGYRIGFIGPELDFAIRKHKGVHLIKSEFKNNQDEELKA
jgi:hypothetical protein